MRMNIEMVFALKDFLKEANKIQNQSVAAIIKKIIKSKLRNADITKKAKEELLLLLKDIKQSKDNSEYLITTLLAFCARNGIGYNDNEKHLAYQLCSKANEKKYPLAQYVMSMCYFYGNSGIKEDKKTAIELCKLAADNDVSSAQIVMSNFYSRGYGNLIEKNEGKSRDILIIAALQGNKLAHYYLGKLFENGNSIQKVSLPMSFSHYQAAAKYISTAAYKTGQFYELGKGINVDVEKAKEYYTYAIKHGNSEAKKALVALEQRIKIEEQIKLQLEKSLKNEKIEKTKTLKCNNLNNKKQLDNTLPKEDVRHEINVKEFLLDISNFIMNEAVENDSPEKLMQFFGMGMNFNDLKSNGRSLVYDIIKLNKIKIFKFLIEHIINANSIDDMGQSLLLIASFYGNYEIAHFLVGKGANINRASINGTTSLHAASQDGHNKIVALLLNSGADHNLRTINDSTALHLAATQGRFECVKLLLKAGALINAKNLNGETPLLIACAFQHNQVAHYLITQGADINKARKDGATPLFASIKKYNFQILKPLVSRGAVIFIKLKDETQKRISFLKPHILGLRYDDFEVPYEFFNDVCVVGCEALVDFFLSQSDIIQNLNNFISGTDTLLSITAKNGYLGCMKKLVEKGAQIERLNLDGSTVLIRACQGDPYSKNFEDIIAFILCQKDANKIINAEDENGLTALKILSQYNIPKLTKVMDMLIVRGALVDKPDRVLCHFNNRVSESCDIKECLENENISKEILKRTNLTPVPTFLILQYLHKYRNKVGNEKIVRHKQLAIDL